MIRALSNTTPATRLTVTAASPEELLLQFDESLKLKVAAGEMSETTRTTYLAGLRKFTTWLAEPANGRVESVGSAEVQGFKAAMLKSGSKPSSVNAWLSGLRAFYAWAQEAGRLQDNPTAGVKSAKRAGANKRHRKGALTNDEAARLLKLPLPARERAIIALMLFTAARGVELHRANLSSIKTIDGQLCILVQGKGREDGDEEPLVVANPTAVDALMSWLAERGPDPGPLFTSKSNNNINGRIAMSTIRTIVKEALRAAGIVRADVTTHSLRHTAITNYLKRSGGNIRGAQVLARHASVDTTLIYAHEMERIANAPEQLISYEGGK